MSKKTRLSLNTKCSSKFALKIISDIINLEFIRILYKTKYEKHEHKREIRWKARYDHGIFGIIQPDR